MKSSRKDIPIEQLYAEKLGIPEIVNILSKEPLRILNPIMIGAARARASKITPQELLHNYESKRDFYGVCSLDQCEILKFKLAFYSVLPERFKAVEVSPISPLGVNSVVTRISQDNTMSTIRGSEVISDPTTPLIMECASRRKQLANKKETFLDRVELATCHRVLRLQPFDKTKGYMQHFNLIGLSTAGREKDKSTFVQDVIREHISIWLDFVNCLNKNGYYFDNISVNISNVQILENIIGMLSLPRELVTQNTLNEDFNLLKYFNINLPDEVSSIHEISHDKIEQYNLANILPQLISFEERVMKVLQKSYPNVKFCFDLNRKLGLGYYEDFCYHIFAKNHDGNYIQLADGGSVDWVAKLLSDKKEYAVTSGFGAELIQKLFALSNQNVGC